MLFMFCLVTGFATNPNSIFYIPKIKGQSEEMVKDIYWPQRPQEAATSLTIYRPGLLRCERAESRLLESIARFISNYLDDGLNWWSITTKDLASVIANQALESYPNETELKILEHRDIVKMIV